MLLSETSKLNANRVTIEWLGALCEDAKKETVTLRSQLSAAKVDSKRLLVALPILREYAANNPKHDWRGVTQDPNGVHALLAAIDAPTAARAQEEPKTIFPQQT